MPANPQYLKVPTSEQAREYQKRAVIARKANKARRDLIIQCGRDIMNSKMDVSEEIQQAAARIGYKMGRKATFGEVAFLQMVNKALKDGNCKAFVELLKVSGMHFDQSPEALGGADNPVHVQAVAVAPEQVKEISEALEGDC